MAARACHPSGPSLPAMTAAFTSATPTCFLLPLTSSASMHEQPSKLPWAATIISRGIAAAASSESMFCVKQRRSRPRACSSTRKWCVGVGMKLSGQSSAQRR